MLAITRKNYIREQLRENYSVQITSLAEELNVTKETIRRDLKDMEEAGELIRTHGGAYILDGVQNTLDISTRQVLRTSEKEIIARKCASIVKNGDHIFLDASSTCYFIAKAIMQMKLTVLTSSLEIINLLSQMPNIKLYAVGGEYSAETKSFGSSSAVRNLEQYYFDKSFISCRSVNIESGLTDANDIDAMFHEVALSHAHEKYLAVDRTKLNRSSFSKIAPVSYLDGIIMECSFPKDWEEYLKDNNVKIY